MKSHKVMTTLILVLLALPFLGSVFAHEDHSGDIISIRHGTTTKSPCPPGYRLGCLTSGTYYTLYIDFYYVDSSDHDQRIHSLSFQSGDGSHESSYVAVGFPITWAYSLDGGMTWTSYSGTGDIDVPYSGKSHSGDIVGTEPHAIVRVTFPVTGSIGDKFYYRVRYKYGCDCYYYGNHYFWYEICDIPVPESQMELPLMTLLGVVAIFMIRRRRLGVFRINLR